MEKMKKFKKGYTSGVYDMFHIGHLNAIKRAKELCDYLIVGVSTDEVVIKNKNKTPIIPFAERAAIVSAIKYVDKVVPQEMCNIDDKIEIVKKYGIDAMFVESDWQGTEKWNTIEKELSKIGCKVVYLPHADDICSTELVTKIRSRGLKIGYTTGVFDMFHIGHLNILKNAKAQCDYLIVGVSTDECVRSYKNKTPIIPFEERKKIVESIEYVDEVVPQTSMDKFEAWKQIGFDILFHGSDWQGSQMYNDIEKKLNDVGCQVVFLPHTDGISSTILREKINNK